MANEKDVAEAPAYESDRDGSASRWTMRRTDASSEDDQSSSEGEDWLMRTDRRSRIGFDDELNGLGGAPVAAEDDEEEDSYMDDGRAALLEEEEEKREFARIAETAIKWRCEGEEKDETERQALAVPRLGAFYMHDDRFQARHRHPRRRNLKEFKDEGKWQHDKFEDISRQKSDNETFNACIKMGRTFEGYHPWDINDQDRSHCYVDRNQFNPNANYIGRPMSRTVGSREPTEYKPFESNSNMNSKARNISGKHSEFTSYADQERVSSQASASNMNSALDRYQSMTYSKVEMSSTKVRDVQPRRRNGPFLTHELRDDQMCIPNLHPRVKGKTVADTFGGSMLYAKELVNPVAKNHFTDFPLQSSLTLPTYAAKSPKLRHQEKPLPLSGLRSCQSTTSSAQIFQSPSVSNLRRKHSFAGSTKSDIAWAGVENYMAQASGRSSLSGEIYAQQKSSVTPQLFPVKISDSQHHVDLGVQAVARGFTGHMAQSDLGFADSGMPGPSVLPGAAGGVSAACCPHYIPSSSDYYVHSLGQGPPVGTASSEVAIGKPMKDSKEVVNDGFGVRRIKPQRQVDSLLTSRWYFGTLFFQVPSNGKALVFWDSNFISVMKAIQDCLTCCK